MPNQYSALTVENINRKMNRKNNPVRSLAQMAREFGVSTSFSRRNGRTDHRVPSDFREQVRALIGTEGLNSLRQRKHINYYAEGYTWNW